MGLGGHCVKLIVSSVDVITVVFRFVWGSAAVARVVFDLWLVVAWLREWSYPGISSEMSLRLLGTLSLVIFTLSKRFTIVSEKLP